MFQVLFLSLRLTVEKFGCLQPHKKMLKRNNINVFCKSLASLFHKILFNF